MDTSIEQASYSDEIEVPGWPGYQLRNGQLLKNGHPTRWLYDSELGFKILTKTGFESCARIIAAIKYGDKLPANVQIAYKDGQNFNCQLANIEVVND